jgi:hypothetical protein
MRLKKKKIKDFLNNLEEILSSNGNNYLILDTNSIKKKKINIKIIQLENYILGIINPIIFYYNENIFIYRGYCTGFFNNKKKISYLKNYKVDKNELFKYPRGFTNTISKYNMIKNKFTEMDKINESKPFERSAYILINNKLFIFGGYYFDPCTNDVKNSILKNNMITTKECSILTINEDRNENKISYEIIDVLDFPIHSTKVLLYNNKIYFLGGAYTRSEINNDDDTNFLVNNLEIGKYFFYLKINSSGNIIKNSLEYINNFPGSPRMDHVFVEYNNYFFVIGGHCITNIQKKYKSYRFFNHVNVLDNWKYDIKNNKWIKLNNLPYVLSAFGFCKYKNKYLVFIGGDLSDNLSRVEDEKIIKNKDINCYNFELKYKITNKLGLSYNQPIVSNLIILYDLEMDKYYVPENLDNNLFLFNVSNPSLINVDDEIYIYGGEANSFIHNDYFYPTHNPLFFKIKIDIYTE